MSLSKNDFKNLVKAAHEEDTYLFDSIMNREDRSGELLKDFFTGHVISMCGHLQPHQHLQSFAKMISFYCAGESYKLSLLLEMFDFETGSLKEKHDKTLAMFGIADMVKNALSLTASLEREIKMPPKMFTVRFVGKELVVQGDHQPSDAELFEMLSPLVEGYEKFSVRRVDSNGYPFNPAQRGMSFDGEDKIEISFDNIDDSFGAMLSRIKSMKKSA